MPNLSIKEVPESLTEKLRQRAARNHRSLQGELMALIETAVGVPEGDTIGTMLLTTEPVTASYGGPKFPSINREGLPPSLAPLLTANRTADPPSMENREARLKRLREIASGTPSSFRADDRLTREEAHDRALLRRAGL